MVSVDEPVFVAEPVSSVVSWLFVSSVWLSVARWVSVPVSLDEPVPWVSCSPSTMREQPRALPSIRNIAHCAKNPRGNVISTSPGSLPD
jgi:hypothetical protein